MPTDAERIRRIANGWGLNDFRRTHLETMVSDALAAVRAESSAEIDRLRQRCGELERERDEAREEVERLTAVEPHTGKEIADLALKWAVAGWMSHSTEMFTAERRKFEHHVLTTFCACARPYKDRAEAAEARLAQVRADALEEAALIADTWLTVFGALEIKHVPARQYACDAVADIAAAIRALARDTDTGGEQP
jgi:hypothetical protein